MQVKNIEVHIGAAELAATDDLGGLIESKLGGNVLRWFVSRAGREGVTVEATVVEDLLTHVAVSTAFYPGRSAVLSIIPTGVGCELGGYAGDAAPLTRLLSGCVDYVITNPNALNASDFIGSLDRVLYTEGYCMDLLAKGCIDLWVPQSNKVGLIVERSDEWALDLVFNLMNTTRAVHGVDIVDYVVTDEPIGSRCERNPSGAYVGSIANPRALFRACEALLDAGATAIGVTTNIQGLPSNEYVQHFLGAHPNPMGGVEALISHLIVNRYRVPAAHAPMINVKGADTVEGGRAASSGVKKIRLAHNVVDARGAGEMASSSGLACALVGLARAPQIFDNSGCRYVDRVNMKNVVAVVTPASTLGGIPVLHAHKRGIPIIAVRANRTVLDVTAAGLGLPGVIEVENYTEAAGVVVALRQGISLETLYRPLRTLDHRNVAETKRLQSVAQ